MFRDPARRPKRRSDRWPRRVPLMLFLMLLFLMAQLHSFSRLALVLSIVPMGFIGIVMALLIFRRPLGFVAILGILALMGSSRPSGRKDGKHGTRSSQGTLSASARSC
jgi:Cu/Ag efflux pump CusA